MIMAEISLSRNPHRRWPPASPTAAGDAKVDVHRKHEIPAAEFDAEAGEAEHEEQEAASDTAYEPG